MKAQVDNLDEVSSKQLIRIISELDITVGPI